MFIIISCFACSKKPDPAPPAEPGSFYITKITVNDKIAQRGMYFFNVNKTPVIKITFSAPVDKSAVAANFSFSGTVSFNVSYSNNDSVVVITPPPLADISKYTLTILSPFQSAQKVLLGTKSTSIIITAIDPSDKFPTISDNALLDKIQQQTLTYFWDFGHPVSGMARERNSSGDVVTTGGTGFGVMSIIAGINRNFITRTDGLQRINTIVDFLKNKCTRYHGVFAHWINGATGATVPFSAKDNGADLVETSFLMQGLLCARQYFNLPDPAETTLRDNINILWNGIEWSWFRKGGQDVLYWHWSPNFNFDLNVQIKGWNEALIVYALAASSNTDAIPKSVYDNGWASNGGMKNGGTFYGVQLPLGPSNGGPLFFSHYSFLGINPHDLTDTYANYFTQNTAHSLINYNYCVANPQLFNGYSASNWGLTASDDNYDFYKAHSPTNDDGVISPTAAISSIPYTPTQSLAALKYFYYRLGDKLFKQYGFIDAFNLSEAWFADSFLAIDQGPQIVMIENYRSGLLWNLFMSCPEVKTGMKKIGFQSPNL
ncbi:MAG: glucoamylase family protein [Ginsengibacter sp.]